MHGWRQATEVARSFETRYLQVLALGVVVLVVAGLVVLATAPSLDRAQTTKPTATNRPKESTAAAQPTAPATTASARAGTFYVSRNSPGGDGRSWQTAWNELGRIDWEAVQPGDVILLDGGAEQMVYETTLAIGRSGRPGSPITIRLADEPGRNGRVVVFGGRRQPLPYCGQPDYDPSNRADRPIGVDFGGRAFLVLDGGKWRGITIHGHGQHGIHFEQDAADILVRYVEVFDNGTASRESGRWYPGQDGIRLTGTRITFERAIVYDNGEDAFQSNGGLRDFTLRESWLYNARKDARGGVWNYCRHPDGVQVWDGGEQRGITVERSVIGPGFMHGILLGDADAVVHDLTVRDTLLYGSGNASVQSSPNQPKPSRGWRFDNVTSDRQVDDRWTNLGFQWEEGLGDPKQLTIANSVFTGGYSMEVPAKGNYSGNFTWLVDGVPVGRRTDPRYADHAAYGSQSLDADFRIAPGSPASGAGSPITSARALLALP